jgi:hypothetical protein
MALDIREDVNYNLSAAERGVISFSYNSIEEETIEDNVPLFKLSIIPKLNISTKNLLSFTSDITSSEAYINLDKIVGLGINTVIGDKGGIINITPNPWVDNTSVSYSTSTEGKVEWYFYDTNGRLLAQEITFAQKGKNSFDIKRSLFDRPGVIYVKMISDENNSEGKMIILK